MGFRSRPGSFSAGKGLGAKPYCFKKLTRVFRPATTYEFRLVQFGSRLTKIPKREGA